MAQNRRMLASEHPTETTLRKLPSWRIVDPMLPLRVALAYAVFGMIWILLTDLAVRMWIDDPVLAGRVNTFKGWFFVLITAALLAAGLQRNVRRVIVSEAQLYRSEERFRLLVTAVQDYAIFLLDTEGHVTSWNAGAQRLKGYAEREIVGQHFSCFFLPEDVEAGKPDRLLREAREHGRVEEEGWRVNKAGKKFWASAVVTALRDERDRLRGYAEITRDATQRKQAEDELRHVNRALRLATGCSQLLTRAGDEKQLLEEVCKVVVEDAGYRLAWVGYVEYDAARSIVPVAQAGYEHGYLKALRLTWADTERGRGPTGMAARTGHHFVVQNVQTEPFYAPWREEAMRRGYAASAALPLALEGKVFGVLSIYAAEADAFEPAEIDLLTQVATDLSVGIGILRTRAEQQRAEAALRESEAKFRTLIEQALVGVYVIQHDQFVYANPRMAEMFGYTTAEMLAGLPLTLFVHPDDRALVMTNIRKRFSGEVRTLRYRVRGVRKDGSIFSLEVQGELVQWSGEPAILGAALDMPERAAPAVPDPAQRSA